jgi:hypothetical protein
MLVPEGDDGLVRAEAADEIIVYKSLKEFADEFPKRERKRRTRNSTKAVRMPVTPSDITAAAA